MTNTLKVLRDALDALESAHADYLMLCSDHYRIYEKCNGDHEHVEAACEDLRTLIASLEAQAVAESYRDRITQLESALVVAREALESCSQGDYSTGHVIDPSFDEDLVNAAIAAIDSVGVTK